MSRFLIEASLGEATRRKYKDAVSKFLSWCDENNYDATNIQQLDELLTDYLHELYEQNDGGGKGLGACSLCRIVLIIYLLLLCHYVDG